MKEADLERAFERCSLEDVLLTLQQALHRGYLSDVIRMSAAAAAAGHASDAIRLTEAAAYFALGEHRKAVETVDGVLGRSPHDLPALHLRARIALALGDRATAVRLLTQVVGVFPDFPGAHDDLTAMLLPGRRYVEVLSDIHALTRPRTYLEIGVEYGDTLSLATTVKTAVGVDPAGLPLRHPVAQGTRLFTMKSDDFFAQETRESLFHGDPVDLAFIDGMHLFEFALRDFINVERWASPRSTIVMHDCLPVSTVAAQRECVSTMWVGDTWKVLECLLAYRTDLRISVVPAPPSGIVIVRGLDPSSVLLGARMDEILARYRDLPYPYEPGGWPARYRFVSNDLAGVAAALE